MNLKFWKDTVSLKPFQSVEEYEQFERDLVEDAAPGIKLNAAVKHTNIKKGIGQDGKKYDSFAEYTFTTYMREIKHIVVTRNNKDVFFYYFDENNKQRKYYPDFFSGGQYYEVKGFFTAKDACKKAQVPNVDWYFQADINLMAFELDTKIGKSWRDGFIQTNITC